VKDITKEDGTKTDDFHQIQAEAKLHFELLLTEDNNADLNIQEELLLNIPRVINQEDNAKLNKGVTEK
jgi:hypothetical protein